MGFSKKRFFVTLGLSILIWLISGFIQVMFNKGESGNYLFGSGCEVTGYPLAMCVSSDNLPLVFLVYVINIVFWFWVIHFFWNIFSKKRF